MHVEYIDWLEFYDIDDVRLNNKLYFIKNNYFKINPQKLLGVALDILYFNIKRIYTIIWII